RVLRLESLRAYPNSFGSTYQEQKQRNKLAFENYVEQKHLENFILGAFIRDRLIGICGFYRLSDARCRHRGEIIQMYVKAEHQGKQIGYHLLQATVAEAFALEGLEQIELQVMSNLESANKLYERAGFQEIGMQKGFYKQDEVYLDQRLMALYPKRRD
ncbi:MAG: GNAT family N-acetyltransferase, partial [Bacteroidota bacterium]